MTKEKENPWRERSFFWDGDERHEVVLHKYDSYSGWQLLVRKYKKYHDHDMKPQFEQIGEELTLITIRKFMQKLHGDIWSYSFGKRGFQAWMRSVFNEVRGDFRGFLEKYFGITPEDLPWERTYNPSSAFVTTEYDWTEKINAPTVPIADQCVDLAARIDHILKARKHLSAGGFEEFVKRLDSDLKCARSKLEEILTFQKILIDTPKREIPKWAIKGDPQVCKKRQHVLAKKYAHLLETEKKKDNGSDIDDFDDDDWD